MSAKNGLPCMKCGANDWGKSGGCRPCQAERHRLWQKANPDKVRKNNTRWRKANPERWNEYTRRYQRANQDKTRQTSRRWRLANPEACKRYQEGSRRRRRANPEKDREQCRRWRANNPDKVKESNRRWLKKYPDKHVAQVQRRRAKMLGAGGSYTAAEWQALCEEYDNKCLCCGRKEPDIKLTVDHVLPIDLGGRNDIDNLQPLCKSCNSRKNNRYIDYRNRPALLRWVQRALFD